MKLVPRPSLPNSLAIVQLGHSTLTISTCGSPCKSQVHVLSKFPSPLDDFAESNSTGISTLDKKMISNMLCMRVYRYTYNIYIYTHIIYYSVSVYTCDAI